MLTWFAHQAPCHMSMQPASLVSCCWGSSHPPACWWPAADARSGECLLQLGVRPFQVQEHRGKATPCCTPYALARCMQWPQQAHAPSSSMAKVARQAAEEDDTLQGGSPATALSRLHPTCNHDTPMAPQPSCPGGSTRAALHLCQLTARCGYVSQAAGIACTPVLWE